MPGVVARPDDSPVGLRVASEDRIRYNHPPKRCNMSRPLVALYPWLRRCKESTAILGYVLAKDQADCLWSRWSACLQSTKSQSWQPETEVSRDNCKILIAGNNVFIVMPYFIETIIAANFMAIRNCTIFGFYILHSCFF